MAIPKCLVIVAHPDDCIILAGGFIQKYNNIIDFDICYLTYQKQDSRAQELANFWSARKTATEFLGYVDDYRDMEQGISFNTAQAESDINRVVENYDLAVTHAKDGDYGHIHHKFVHDIVAKTSIPKVYFANTEVYNNKIVEKSWYTLEEIPLHSDVVKDEWSYLTGEYYYNITEDAHQIIYENTNTR
jgi:LmbE family N-acetylglucosaminyl deacetylase